MMRSIVCAIVTIVCFWSLVQAESVGWRTDGTGHYPDARPPLDWSTPKHVVWKTPTSSWSNSSPVVIEDRLFVLEEPTTLACLDRATGTLIWSHSNDYKDVLDQGDGTEDNTLPEAHGHNGYSSATPVSDGNHVWAVFGTGTVVCYDMDGNRKWARVLQKPTHGWGHSASPRLVAGKLIVAIIDLFALDPGTGDTIWHTTSQAHWGTAAVTTIGQTPVILAPSGQIVRAADGFVLTDELPKMEWNGPVVAGDRVYCIESTASAWQLPSQADEPFTLKHLWTTQVRGDRHYASPIVNKGLIYTVSREENLSVLDTATGELVYRRKMELNSDNTNSVYTSVTLADDLLFTGSISGELVVFKPGPRYKEVTRKQLESLRSTPVFIGDRMYVRGLEHVWCIGRKRVASPEDS